MEERQAIARLQRGDISGLELLVRRYQVQAVRAAYLIVRDRHLAEDTVQAAFVRAYERIHQFDPTRPFGPWFLLNVVRDAIKAAGRRERLVPLERLVDDREDTFGDLLTNRSSDRRSWPSRGSPARPSGRPSGHYHRRNKPSSSSATFST